MLVELEKAIGWLKENADKYIVDMAIPSYEHDFHVGGKCWEDLKAAMPEAERPKIKATLLCDGAEVKGAESYEEAEMIRKEIDQTEILLDFMPAKDEWITFYNKLGWFDLTVMSRSASFATKDAEVKDEYKGKDWNSILISKIEIIELNEDKEDE